MIKKEIIMRDDFNENELNLKYWFPYYLPQRSSREASKASYIIKDGVLTLYISDKQKLWCSEWSGEVRVSNLQTGVFSGRLDEKIGQHHFTDGLIVREEQKKK